MEDDGITDQRAAKAVLRQEALARRDAIAADRRIEASLAIADHGAATLTVAPGEIVSGFWPIRSEVDVRPLMALLSDAGARLALPVILDRRTIIFRELVRAAPLVDTGFGTAGPGLDAAELDPTLMLVPLAAFDGTGHRIGYGAGLYDRAIARLIERGRRPRLIGVGFDTQEIPLVPFTVHDQPLDAILTESGLRSFSPRL